MAATVRGRNGGELTPWQKGQSPNPGGLPKGFVSLSRAYATIATLPPDTIHAMAKSGTFPAKWPHDQCFTYIVAARAWSELKDKPIPGLLSELADRTEGKVPQKVQAEVDVRGVLVVPAAQLASGDWSRDVIDAETIETKALTAADDADE